MEKAKLPFQVSVVLFSLLMLPLSAFAQGTIEGTIYDADSGDILPGAQIVILSTNQGAVSDIDGNYVIEDVTPGEYTLEARFIGYGSERQIVAVAASQTINADFTMGATAINLNEVVVTGAGGPVEKRKLGNTISTINAASLQDAPVTSFSEILQGREPGVVGLPSGGQTGEGSRIRIRGSASLSQSNEPIVYIDGVRANSGASIGGLNPGGSSSRLDDLNPEAIERVEILKGAAAATLYGTEASNGVIQIFTKQGSIGKPRFSFQVSQGASSYPDGAYDNQVGFARTRAIADTMSLYLGESVNPYQLVSRNFMEDLYETGYEQIYSGSVEGGSPGITYYASFRYQDEDGPFGGQDNRGYVPGVSTLASDLLTRAQATATLNIFPADNLQFRIASSYTDHSMNIVDSNNNIYGVSSLAQFSKPEYIRYNNLTGTRAFATVNEAMQQQLFQDVNRYVGSFGMNYRPFENLTVDATFGVDFTSQRDEDVRGFRWNVDNFSRSEPLGSRLFRNINNLEVTADVKGTLRHTFGKDFESTLLFGAQGFQSNRTILTGDGVDFPGPGFNVTGAAAIEDVAESFSEVVNIGVFAQEQLGYKDFLFLTVGGRLDANSAFGSNFDAVFYPKVSLSFVPMDAGLLSSSDLLSSLRIRGAVGQSGLQPGAFDALTTYVALSAAGGPGVAPDNLGNADLEPEISTEWEVGFEAGILNDRIGVEATYWNRVVRDALVARQFPVTGGFRATQLDNIGEIEGQGLELGLNGRVFTSSKLSIDLFANAAYLWEQVSDMGGAPPIKVGGSYPRYRNFLLEGYSPGTNFGAQLVEVSPGFLPVDIVDGDGQPDSEQALVAFLGGLTADDASLPTSTAQILLADLDGDNDVLDHYLGKPTPDWAGAFGGSFNFFGNFTLSTLFEYKTGNYYVNNLTGAFRQANAVIGRNTPQSSRVERDYLTGGVDANGNPLNDGNVRLEALREWVNETLALAPFSGLNTIEKADFIRWRELSLTYRAPRNFVQSMGLRNLSLTVAARNVALWTKYSGVDPELNAIGRGAGNNLDDNFLDGVEAFGFATPRRVKFTLRFGF
ncbi:MAG: SusC/RagA family TonB-linked outer membrane protein [Rhodothermaceae bacterium]|nr:SusC/RagA family TonB-linked outer membrane protein [Rhodothermaceae bacterium]